MSKLTSKALIERLENIIGDFNERELSDTDIECVGMDELICIKEALEKQIDKKPALEGDGYADGNLVYDTWICPNCEKHYEVDYDDYDYCPNCGQKIDKSVFVESC